MILTAGAPTGAVPVGNGAAMEVCAVIRTNIGRKICRIAQVRTIPGACSPASTVPADLCAVSPVEMYQVSLRGEDGMSKKPGVLITSLTGTPSKAGR